MVTHQSDPLDLVTRLPREDWSDAYIVLLRVLEKYDPARGKLEHLFRVAWKNARLDRIIKLNGKRNNRPRMQRLNIDMPAPAQQEADTGFRLPSYTHGAVFMFSHGYSYRQIADNLNIPIGTVRSRLNRFYTLNRDNA